VPEDELLEDELLEDELFEDELLDELVLEDELELDELVPSGSVPLQAARPKRLVSKSKRGTKGNGCMAHSDNKLKTVEYRKYDTDLNNWDLDSVQSQV
jgi:hypothetical protein